MMRIQCQINFIYYQMQYEIQKNAFRWRQYRKKENILLCDPYETLLYVQLVITNLQKKVVYYIQKKHGKETKKFSKIS